MTTFKSADIKKKKIQYTDPHVQRLIVKRGINEYLLRKKMHLQLFSINKLKCLSYFVVYKRLVTWSSKSINKYY